MDVGEKPQVFSSIARSQPRNRGENLEALKIEEKTSKERRKQRKRLEILGLLLYFKVFSSICRFSQRFSGENPGFLLDFDVKTQKQKRKPRNPQNRGENLEIEEKTLNKIRNARFSHLFLGFSSIQRGNTWVFSSISRRKQRNRRENLEEEGGGAENRERRSSRKKSLNSRFSPRNR